MRSRILFALISLISATANAQTQGFAVPMPTGPREILDAAFARYHLFGPTPTPWHLSAMITVFDSKGEHPQQGTLDMIYAGPREWRIRYDFPDFKQTKTKDGTFLEGNQDDAPYLLGLAYREMFHPAPAAADYEGVTPAIREAKFDTTTLTCVMLNGRIEDAPKPESIPIGLFPGYCVGPDRPTLRIAYLFGGDIVAVYNKIGRFRGNEVPTDLSVMSGGKKLVEVQVTELQAVTNLPEDTFAHGPEAHLVTNEPAGVAGTVAAGGILNKVAPHYPESARRNRIQGTVLIHAVIGRGGNMQELRIVSAPDVDLAVAAMVAVREWKYRPYLLNGIPTSVSTTITVNFNIQ